MSGVGPPEVVVDEIRHAKPAARECTKELGTLPNTGLHAMCQRILLWNRATAPGYVNIEPQHGVGPYSVGKIEFIRSDH